MENSTSTSANGPVSATLKMALATVNKTGVNGEATEINSQTDKSFPEDRLSKDYYFDSYAHL